MTIGNLLKDFQHLWSMIEITSYEPAILLGIQNICKSIDIDLLVPRSETWMTPEIVSRLAVEKARLARTRAIHLHPSQLSSSVVDFVQSRNLSIHCWDVNDLETYNFIKSLGIEQFTSDNINRFLNESLQ